MTTESVCGGRLSGVPIRVSPGGRPGRYRCLGGSHQRRPKLGPPHEDLSALALGLTRALGGGLVLLRILGWSWATGSRELGALGPGPGGVYSMLSCMRQCSVCRDDHVVGRGAGGHQPRDEALVPVDVGQFGHVAPLTARPT